MIPDEEFKTVVITALIMIMQKLEINWEEFDVPKDDERPRCKGRRCLTCEKHHEEVHHTNKHLGLKPINKSNYPKLIRVEDQTHKDLMQCGVKGETFDQIIKRLIKKAGE